MKILVLNGGSSSFKCWFQDVPDGQLPSEGLAPRWSARADWSRNQEPPTSRSLDPMALQ